MPVGLGASREYSKGNGYNLQIMSRLTIFSMLSVEGLPGWGVPALSTSPKEPDMFIYFLNYLSII